MARPCAFSQNSSDFYDGGSKTNGAFAVAKVTISKTFVEGTSSANPQKIDVWIETPGNLSATNRMQFLFTGVIPQN
jgi:hypothetical protein